MKVLIAVDGSAIAEKTFEWYFNCIHKEDNELLVVHHCEQPHIPTFSLSGGASFPADKITEIMVDFNKKIGALENKYTMKILHHKVKGKVMMDASDDGPGHALVKIAKANGCDMIVMGTRGLGTFKRTILGSVSNDVLHNSHIPVCICPM